MMRDIIVFWKRKWIQAKFSRTKSTCCIEVSLPDEKAHIALWSDIVEFCAKELGEKELEAVVRILSRDRDAMLKQRNFPPLYKELLSDLIKVLDHRKEEDEKGRGEGR